MALGIITAGAVANNSKGASAQPLFLKKVSIVGDNAYVTGGTVGVDALLAAALGQQPGMKIIEIISGDCGDHYLVYKDANGGTLQVFLRSSGAELANAADISGVTINFTIIHQ